MEKINQMLSELRDPDPFMAYSKLTKGIFVDRTYVQKIIRAMTDREAPPILTANSVRSALPENACRNTVLQICEEQLAGLLAAMKRDPTEYAELNLELTRVSVGQQEKRKQATGIVFSADDSQISWVNSIAYPHMWASDLLELGHNDVSLLRDKLALTLGINNRHKLRLTGKTRPSEHVLPVVVDNQDIYKAILSFDMNPQARFRIASKHLILTPNAHNKVDAFETPHGLDSVVKPDLTTQSKVGEIFIENGKLNLEDLRHDFREALAKFIHS